MANELQEVLTELQNKMSSIVIVLSLIGDENSGTLMESLRKLELENNELKNRIEYMNTRLDVVEAEFEKAKILKETMTAKYKEFSFLEENLKSKGFRKTTVEAKLETETVPQQGSRKVNLPSMAIAFLSQQEFDSVPKYLKGRYTRDDVNAAIADFNSIIIEKYSILCKDKKQLTAVEHKKLLKYKADAWQTDDIKKFKFCIYDDLKNTPSFRLETKGVNLLMIMRHCGRIKENRKPKLPIRYLVNA